ncbi:hypothetical protein [Xanthocytophaga agilis]|uniref:Uncharacterized protein n=1 Tax=Xanthocytophaga agilis TaxID=3048010 RepID=A0AAE3UHH8_9BACT|nr:hypothetical protein [Xanthocytophaga agilis]MDJ1503492.1 hypothetical protein [Xanthocytophaga agilis]
MKIFSLINFIYFELTYFVTKKEWLYNSTNDVIIIKHNDLYIKKSIRVWTYICDVKNGLLTVLSVVVMLFFLALIDIDISTFLTIGTAKLLIDQRISNVATIISMTLAVIGFLLGNIAVKEPFAYKILFKRSGFYPIIFYILTTLIYLLIISTLRDFLSEGLFIRLVLTGTCLVICIPIFIGYLFKAIIDFTNSTKIHSFLKEELLVETKDTLRNELVNKYSRQIFKASLESCWLVELSQSISNSNINETAETIICDINIGKIKEFIKRQESNTRRSYEPLFIDKEFTKNTQYILGQTLLPEDRERLNSCIRLSQKREKEESILRSYYVYKLNEAANTSNSKILDQILAIQLELIELELKHK